ncbi:Major facilitator superfamily protein [Trifolium repens]|nr:Major facilitator superfamily protein [Trifolium repens]
MASIIASLPPPLLLHGRKSFQGNFQNFPVSLLSGRRSNIAFVVKASGESSESSTSLTVFKSVQSVWDTPEDRLGLIGLGFAAVVALWASTNLIAAIDKLPVIPVSLEVIGILFSVWFTYRYLLFKPDREELFQILNKSASDILGRYFVVRFGERFYRFAMRGRQRVASREFITAYDSKDENPASVRVPGAKPCWRRSLRHVIVASLSSFLYGYHIGVVNETLESISIDLGFSGNTLAEGLVVSICLGGAFIGSLFSGWIADGVGRRRSFQLCALPMIIGAIMSATSTSLWGMLLGRLFVGTGMGLGPPVAALYVAEVSPPAVRGTFGGLTQIATCLGLMGALFIGIPAKEIAGWWRICFWVSVIPSTALAIFMEICAESPYWLFKRGRTIEAEAEFEKLLGGLHVKPAMSELTKSDRGDESSGIKISELLFGCHARVMFIGSTLFALQQLSGINAVFYFSSAVFESFGVPSKLGNTCVGICNLLGSIISMILMDKLGRKVLLLGSFLGMGVTMGLQVIAASPYASIFGGMYLSVGGMLLYVLSFALGAGPVPCLLMSEILPGKIRAKAMAICLAVHWVINFFVGLLFLRMLEQLGAQLLYSIFGSFCLLAVLFVKKYVLETKGKSLQEIEIALLAQEAT